MPTRPIELILARQLVSSLQTPVVVVDADGVVVASSDAAEPWLAPGTESALPPFRARDGAPLPDPDQPVAIALRGHRTSWAILMPAGSAGLVEVVAWPLLVADGDVAGAIVLLRPADEA